MNPPIVAFATPSLTHSVCIEYHRSSKQTSWALAAKGYDEACLDVCGNQFIANARNLLVRDFLTKHPGVENFFFLDDDLGWPAHKVIEFIERPEDILVGVYPKRSDQEDWPVVIKNNGGVLEERDGLIRCLRGPTGFMRIKRHVLEAMLSQVPTYKEINAKGEVEEIPGIFCAGAAPDGWFWTEDYVFCNNAVNMGFEIWADPNVEFTHRGQKAWSGSLSKVIPTFRKRAREAEKARKKAERQFPTATLVTVDGRDVIEGEIIKRSDAA